MSGSSATRRSASSTTPTSSSSAVAHGSRGHGRHPHLDRHPDTRTVDAATSSPHRGSMPTWSTSRRSSRSMSTASLPPAERTGRVITVEEHSVIGGSAERSRKSLRAPPTRVNPDRLVRLYLSRGQTTPCSRSTAFRRRGSPSRSARSWQGRPRGWRPRIGSAGCRAPRPSEGLRHAQPVRAAPSMPASPSTPGGSRCAVVSTHSSSRREPARTKWCAVRRRPRRRHEPGVRRGSRVQAAVHAGSAPGTRRVM